MQHHRTQQTHLPAEHDTTPATLAPDPLRPGQAATTATVRLIAGADVADIELVARTVAEARAVAGMLFGIRRTARAVLDGHEVREDQVLGAGQVLEFVKHAGSKGATGEQTVAAETAGPTLIVAGERVLWRRGDEVVVETSVSELLARVSAAADPPERWRLHPHEVRAMIGRGSATAVVIEMPPGPREVRWIADDAPDDLGGKYDRWRLSFPWVVLVVVFDGGELSNLAQAFYRTKPLATLDDALYYPNLLNVTSAYDQESWVCLVNLERSLAELTWPRRVHIVTEHFWHAAFTRSAEAHEGSSHFRDLRLADPRLASPAAWAEATCAQPYFALEVKWRRARCTVRETLVAMLDAAAPARPIVSAAQLATCMQQVR
jgi:hypothetical protein